MNKLLTIITLVFISLFVSPTSAQYLELVSSIELPQAPRLLTTKDNYVYMIEPGFGISVIDVTYPDNPEIIDTIPNPTGYSARKIKIYGDNLYCINISTGVGTIHSLLSIIDISNPIQPVEQSQTELGIRLWDSMEFYGNYIFVGGGIATMHIFDISDPSAPILHQDLNVPGRKQYMRVYGDYLFINCVSHTLKVYDISNPNYYVMVGSFDEYNTFAYEFDITNDIAFLANCTSVLVLDVSLPAHLSYVTEYTIEDSNFNFYIYLEIDDNYLYLALDETIYCLDISNPTVQNVVSSISLSNDIGDLEKNGEYLYVTTYDSFDVLRINQNGIGDDLISEPNVIGLHQNYPNPFNASTQISYELSVSSEVKLDIYDILGRHIATLEDGTQPAGSHQVVWNADELASGVYFYKLQANDYNDTKRLLLIK